MPFDPREFEGLLQSKFQFTPARTREKGHRWVELRLEGLPVIATKTSHSKDEIGLRLESRIAKQLHVRVPFLRAMLDCTRSREDYYHQLRTDPYPPFPDFGRNRQK